MDKEKRPYKEKITERIQTGMIIDRLHKHVDGEVEMSATQINAARILLAKVVPDQSSSQSSHSVTVQDDTKPREENRNRAKGILQAINNG